MLIGIQYVGAGGRVVRAGGRVVKNVAGYDLMKVMTGSFGTLGVVTEVAFKVRPVPERYAIALARFDRADAAFGTAQRLHDALPLANLEIVSAGLGLSRPAAVLLAAGLAGTRAEIEFLRDRIVKLAEHKIEFLDGDEATRKHQELRDAELSDATLAALLATLPAELPQCLRDCGEIEYVAHAGSGVAEIFVRGELSLDEAKETVARWRSVARSVNGHVRLIRACGDVRDALDFFDTPNSAALALMRRLKQAFDPENIFNPDCFVAGL